MIYFISGHRDITQEEFNKLYVPVIDDVLKTDTYDSHFVVGDYYGADIMAQNYIASKGYSHKLTVYHMFESPRNINPSVQFTVGGFDSDEARDSAMTKISDIDIAFVRKGRWNSGTAQNIKRRYTF